MFEAMVEVVAFGGLQGGLPMCEYLTCLIIFITEMKQLSEMHCLYM